MQQDLLTARRTRMSGTAGNLGCFRSIMAACPGCCCRTSRPKFSVAACHAVDKNKPHISKVHTIFQQHRYNKQSRVTCSAADKVGRSFTSKHGFDADRVACDHSQLTGCRSPQRRIAILIDLPLHKRRYPQVCLFFPALLQHDHVYPKTPAVLQDALPAPRWEVPWGAG